MPKEFSLDDDNVEWLAEEARPLEGINDVLRRLRGRLGDVEPPTKSTRKRAAPGEILPESAYELPILRVLLERGGSAPTADVIDAVGEAMAGELTELDEGHLESGEVRWRNRVAFAKLRLQRRGLVESSHRGHWALTERGRRAAESGEIPS